MKILFLNTNIGYGGASKMIVWVANQCAMVGNEVVFFTYRNGDCLQHLDGRVKHVHIQLEVAGGGSSIFSTVKYLHRYIKRERFDLGVAFLSPSFVRLKLASYGTNIKLLFSQRGDPYFLPIKTGIISYIVNALVRFCFEHADAYVFQTHKAQEFYSKEIQERSVVIPNPIKPLIRTELRGANISKSIVSLGRIDFVQKRQDVLIDAFKKIQHKYPDYILEIYGDGDDESKLIELIKDNKQILYKGKTSDIVGVIQNSAMFVLSSDFEGIPNALLEAMSLGVPCVSTDCSPGGAALLIQPNSNGQIVPCGNSDLLASAISYYLDHPVVAEIHGKTALKVNDDYAESRISNLWIDFISQIKS